MINATVNFNKPNSNIIWKYLDLHRFIYFLTEQKLFFTRLDKLDVPFEGITLKFLRRDSKYQNIPLELKDFPKSVSNEERIQLLNEKKLHDYLKKQETETSQNRQYVNCWFSGERESMAMWNLYSNSDSVALKLDFESLNQALIKSSHEFIIQNGNRASIIGDNVKYLKLNPFDDTLPKQNLKYSSFKKDVSYKYESEYRLLVLTLKGLDKNEEFYTLPFEIEKLKVTIITHPNMENWKHDNIRKLIEISNSKIKLEKSSTVLRRKNYG